jgi:hypothetical protein
LLSLLPTITELFSWRGSDNFFLPIFTVAWIQLVLNILFGFLDLGGIRSSFFNLPCLVGDT